MCRVSPMPCITLPSSMTVITKSPVMISQLWATFVELGLDSIVLSIRAEHVLQPPLRNLFLLAFHIIMPMARKQTQQSEAHQEGLPRVRHLASAYDLLHSSQLFPQVML